MQLYSFSIPVHFCLLSIEIWITLTPNDLFIASASNLRYLSLSNNGPNAKDGRTIPLDCIYNKFVIPWIHTGVFFHFLIMEKM